MQWGVCLNLPKGERKEKKTGCVALERASTDGKGLLLWFSVPTAHNPQREILPALSIERPASSPGAEVEQQVTSRGRPTVLCELQREASSGEIEKLLLHLRVSTISVCQTQKTLS